MVDKIVSHFKIIEKIDEGGMGKIFLAQDTALNRRVALKFLPSHLTSNQMLIDRFRREAQAAAALKHPNIVTIHEMGKHEDQFYMAMEYIDGICLNRIIEQKQVSVSKALLIGIQICRGLRKAHSIGIIHRDIKPANIMIDKDGWVKILDFGLAKLTEHTRITKYGVRMGTAPYISPEQIRGEELGPASDLFSMGVIMYQLITGQHPFDGQTEEEIMYAILQKKPKALSRYKARVSPGLQRIVDKLLRKEVHQRYQNVDELLVALKVEKRNLARKERARRAIKKKSLTDTITFTIRDFDTNRFRSGLAKVKTSLSSLGRLRRRRLRRGIRRLLPSRKIALTFLVTATSAVVLSGAFKKFYRTGHSQTVVMSTLINARDTKTLFQTFDLLRKKQLISLGKDVDFRLLDHCYLFIFDENEVLDVYEVKDNLFCSLNSNETFTTPPNKFSGKNKVWVQDLSIKHKEQPQPN